jgi:hypothetical protein
VPLIGGGKVQIDQRTDYPVYGKVLLVVNPVEVSHPFAINLRVPVWSRGVSVAVNGKLLNSLTRDKGYVSINRSWKTGDTVTYDIDMSPRVVLGDHDNNGCMAVMYGPLVLALDKAYNWQNDATPVNMAPAVDNPSEFRLSRVETTKNTDTPMFVTDGIMYASDATKPMHCKLFLTPYYAAGVNKSFFEVWMKRPSVLKATPVSKFEGAVESRSRLGNADGSVCDGDKESYVVTYDGTMQSEDWYALTLSRSVTIRRVVFTQGKLFDNGGWFDTSGGKPRIQCKTSQSALWTDLAVIDSYPNATAVDPAGLKEFQDFQVTFPPISVCAIRVIGKPACGGDPRQTFSSCAELGGF